MKTEKCDQCDEHYEETWFCVTCSTWFCYGCGSANRMDQCEDCEIKAQAKARKNWKITDYMKEGDEPGMSRKTKDEEEEERDEV